MWNIATGELIRTLEGNVEWVWKCSISVYLTISSKILLLCYSPDGKSILSSDASGLLREWDAETGALKRTYRVGLVTILLNFAIHRIRIPFFSDWILD